MGTDGVQDANASAFVANLKDNAATKMGAMHAIYGKLIVEQIY